MTEHTYWRCSQGHEGHGPLPDGCPHCPGGKPCGAECWPITVDGRRKPQRAKVKA